MRVSAFAFVVASCLLAAPGVASAGSADAAAAEALYDQATAEMEAGDFATACPKLEESFRLDPATGALLTLAACYERAGKLASAWVRYLDVEARASKEGDKDRANVAHQKAAELAPRLPRVTIELGPEVTAIPGVEVRRDQTVLSLATLGTALPVDPGPHVIEVRAPGRVTERRELLAVEAKAERFRIDALATSDGSAPPPAAPHEGSDDGLTGVQIGGLVLGGAGALALGVGVGFGVAAAGASSDLEAVDGYDPETGVCPGRLAECRDHYDSASSAATMSTIFVIGGSVLAAAGVVMVLVGGGSSAENARIEVVPTMQGGLVQGVF